MDLLNPQCERCDQLLRNIGPFAREKREGEPSVKFDGFYDYECINETCENQGKIIKLKSWTDV